MIERIHPRRFLWLMFLVFMLLLPTRGIFVVVGQRIQSDGASAQAPAWITTPSPDLQPLSQARRSYHSETGKLRFVGSQPGAPLFSAASLSMPPDAEAVARSFLQTYAEQFGLKDPAHELNVMKAEQLQDGRSFVRYQQTYQGVPILGGELIVQLDAKSNVLSANGEVLPDVSLSTVPDLTPDQASQLARDMVAKEYSLPSEALQTSQPSLWIYNPLLLGAPGMRLSRLVWRMDVSANDLYPVRELVLVDAHSGAIALHFNQVDTALNRVIYNNNNNSSISLPGTTPVRTEGGPATGNLDADLAYDYSGNTYNFYFTRHGRDSLDGMGMTLISTVRYCPDAINCPYQNAYWDGKQMVFGQGFSSADDVVAHELTHGVTENTSNLFYYMQSGAINESFSDIWGEFIDLTYDGPYDNDTPTVRWKLGEDIPGYGAIRDMQNPTTFSDPDKMSSIYYYCATTDNGGVHTNSGVGNKAAYLMVDGGTFNGFNISGIGIDKTAKIFYEVQAHMLTSAADYQDLADALSQACSNLVGTSGITLADCTEVRKAIAAVEMDKQPVSCAAPEAPVCDSYGSDSQFTLSLGGWNPVSGSWGLDPEGYALTSGAASSFSSLSAPVEVTDFEYTARMRRDGCDTCSNGILIRGSPAPLQSGNRWNQGYAFLYTRSGSVAVFKLAGATETALLPWTNHPAVITGDAWNLLKVVVRGNTFTFYVNDKLVWSGSDSSYLQGIAGLLMYRDASSSGNLLQVDYARLAGGTPMTLFYDSFETGLGKWSHAALSGKDQWIQDSGYATDGSFLLYGKDQPEISDFYAQLASVLALPATQTPFLRFDHAYDFEATTNAAYDGGVLEYSADGGPWTDASLLIRENGYNGAIASGYGNPLAGRSAFVRESFGYISTRLNLDPLKGKSVRFRFRLGTDSSVDDLGWIIDNFHIYTCSQINHKVFLPMTTR